MKYWTLISAALNRKRWRTVLTIGSLTIAFMLFGMLRSVAVAFTAEVDFEGDDRLIVMSKLSFTDPLPLSYRERIRAIEGVREKRDFINTRTGMVAGKSLADKFNWKVGDKIPIIGDIWPKEDMTNLWEFDLVGIFEEEESDPVYGGEDQVFINHEYFEETRAWGKGTVGNYIVKVKDKSDNEKIAKEIDKMFANSFNETKTSTESAFSKMFAEQVGDIGFIMNSILSAVFFTMLLVTGNTMSQAVRERTSEFAVFKTVGYSDRTILSLVLCESIVICLLSMILGIILSFLVFLGISGDLSEFAGDIAFEYSVILWALVAALLMAMISGLPPALGAMRLKVVDALRKD